MIAKPDQINIKYELINKKDKKLTEISRNSIQKTGDIPQKTMFEILGNGTNSPEKNRNRMPAIALIDSWQLLFLNNAKLFLYFFFLSSGALSLAFVQNISMNCLS